MSGKARVHARHIHIRAPKLLVDEFEAAIRMNYPKKLRMKAAPQPSKVIRGLMYGYIMDETHRDPLELEAEMYQQERDLLDPPTNEANEK